MLYALLKLIYKAGLWVFFRKFEVRNRHLMPEQGPLLVVSNHPNTFMDPIVIASLLRQQVYFIAKSTVFNSPIKKWLLQHMHLIPVQRREDMPDQPINNEETFRASYQALAAHKTLLIFPEGNSFNERRLRKLKTGAARIALGAEASATGPAGIRILPVGLNYSDPTRFRSDVFVNVGEPIEAGDYLQDYHADGLLTVNKLTERIREQLEQLIVVTPSDEEDELVRHIEFIYKERLAAQAGIAAPGHEQDFLLTKAIIKGLAHFISTQPERVNALRRKLYAYRQQLEALGLQDAYTGQEQMPRLQHMKDLVFLLLGFPLYSYGLVNNYLPYVIPSKVAHLLTEEEEFLAPIMLSAGIFSFPIFYTLQSILFWQLLPGIPYLLLYLISLPLTGFFALRYWNNLQRVQGRWLLLQLRLKKDSRVKQLQQQRQEILNELDIARQEYLLQHTDS